MKTKKNDIYLADLTHTGQIVASNVMPLGIGLIASYLLEKNNDLNIELFKYPKDLDAALNQFIPPVIGFSNYSWNLDIAYHFAKRIKEKSSILIYYILLLYECIYQF